MSVIALFAGTPDNCITLTFSCSYQGCYHGKHGFNCHLGLCNTCKDVKCPLEWNSITIIYKLTEFIQVETIKGNKRVKATVSTYKQPQQEFMERWNLEMISFQPHYYHVEWHKKQLDLLMNTFKSCTLISRHCIFFNAHIDLNKMGFCTKLCS